MEINEIKVRECTETEEFYSCIEIQRKVLLHPNSKSRPSDILS